MENKIFAIVAFAAFLILSACSKNTINLTESKLKLVNREVSSIDKTTETVSLNDKKGAGLAIIDNMVFESGTIQMDIKGENVPGKSFVGVAFNIQNDSTYEAIYFRPFNFQSKEKIRREHSVQYISHPNFTWNYLRTNHEGTYEAAINRQPAPEDWFTIQIEIENEKVTVLDKTSKENLLTIKRLTPQKSNKIGLWVGHNSKGQFKNLRIMN